ncbi:MAG: YHS domain-containing protein [Cytophagales bacterium]|nr:YHS domain-containing protein [Armatimonadota bacterium]
MLCKPSLPGVARVTAALTALTALASTLCARPATADETKPPAGAEGVRTAGAPVLCAVRGEEIADASKAAGKSEFGGKTYHFCCPVCVTTFSKATDTEKAVFARRTDLRTERIVLTQRARTVDAELAALNPALAVKKPAVAAPTKPSASTLYCAITEEEIASKEEAGGKAVYQSKTYYFCCGGCITRFNSNPAKYAAEADARTAKRAAALSRKPAR